MLKDKNLLKKHLAGGVKKGALTEEQANKKFEDWINEKENKINTKKDDLDKAKKDKEKERMEAESERNEKRKKIKIFLSFINLSYDII